MKFKLPKWLLKMAEQQLEPPVERVDNSGGVLSVSNAETEWVTRDGRKIKIGQMTEMHAKNALAFIVRRVINEDRVAYKGKTGKIIYADRMNGLVDNHVSFIDDLDQVVAVENVEYIARQYNFDVDHATQTLKFNFKCTGFK